MLKIAFFGHRNLWGKNIKERIKKEIELNITDEMHCLIGIHWDIDRLALSVCRELRLFFPQIKITVVFTSLNALKKPPKELFSIADMYDDVETIFYDIEEVYFKNKIIVSNRKMVDDSDIIICYVDMKESRSGAKKAIEYALNQGKKVINLFMDQDRPFYGMSKEEIELYWQKKQVTKTKKMH